jgi:hypothetical protein
MTLRKSATLAATHTRISRRYRNAAHAIVLVSALLLGITGCTILPGGNGTMTSDPEHPYNGTRTAAAVEKDFYDTIDDTIKQTGLTVPGWNRATEDGVMLNACAVGSKAGNKFSIDLRGGAVQDPKAAVEKIRSYWESRNWTIETIFDDTDAPNPGMQIAATSPTGIEVVYGPIKNNTNPEKTTDWSSISVQSDCTLDPSLNGVPTLKPSSSPS